MCIVCVIGVRVWSWLWFRVRRVDESCDFLGRHGNCSIKNRIECAEQGCVQTLNGWCTGLKGRALRVCSSVGTCIRISTCTFVHVCIHVGARTCICCTCIERERECLAMLLDARALGGSWALKLELEHGASGVLTEPAEINGHKFVVCGVASCVANVVVCKRDAP